jgi:ABC-type branched-subunit amino acid transport system substrate-binding protein
VGVVLPLTGDLANYGKNAKDGIDLAAEELNEQSAKGNPREILPTACRSTQVGRQA